MGQKRSDRSGGELTFRGPPCWSPQSAAGKESSESDEQLDRLEVS